jgi:TPR repeat protein
MCFYSVKSFHNNESAQNNIGLSYLHGLGVSKDKNKAFEWFEKAAKQGLSYAQSELAMKQRQ